ncbi:MAG: methyltransferase domain-containing protein [Spirochaetes bacterium]|nr:methyltransferase domain-containing protein [Spirochaetota bacterium]
MKGRLRYINIDDNLFNNYTLKLDNQFFKIIEKKIQKIKCQKLSSENNKFVLEVCCGKGEYINYLASIYKDTLFLGLDFSKAAIQRAIKKTHQESLDNVLYVNEDFFDFIKFYESSIIKNQSLNSSEKLDKKKFDLFLFDFIFISFPDPWPKKRHHKRRLVNEESLKKLKNFLKDGGKIFILTDHEDYSKWILNACVKNKDIYNKGFKIFRIIKSYITTSKKQYEKYFPFYETTFFRKSKEKKVKFFCLIKK